VLSAFCGNRTRRAALYGCLADGLTFALMNNDQIRQLEDYLGIQPTVDKGRSRAEIDAARHKKLGRRRKAVNPPNAPRRGRWPWFSG